MKWNAITFDWNYARAFLVTVQEGSFSAAARALGATQPTLSRQITQLEEQLGVTLFERGTRSMALTKHGAELYEQVHTMAQAASTLSLLAAGRASKLEGHVKVTATTQFAALYLPKALKALQAETPEISVEVIASNTLEDLKNRDADIAIRHTTQIPGDLYGEHLGDMKGYYFACPAYLKDKGIPKSREALKDLSMIGFGEPSFVIEMLERYGLNPGWTTGDIMIGSSCGVVMAEMIKSGLGVGLLPEPIAKLYDLEPVLSDIFHIDVPVWLVTHRELKTNPVIQCVYKALHQALSTALKA
ncbi:LysR family transcriptional regulator [Woodsholea maritima]|uniref:LysR family transcriptional regulator n=1 Tax=Woodsholea maritima TaxID=240237 RepID=UPI00035F6AAF|nr:LysR family transcriptional regulator [Woodsholea maritima]